MSHFASYYSEIYGGEVREDESGFIAYIFDGQTCYVSDIYVRPEDRGGLKFNSLYQGVCARAKESGCTHLTCQVGIKNIGCSKALELYLRLGFVLLSAQNDVIVLSKEL